MIVFGLLPLLVAVCALVDLITRPDDQVKHLPKLVWILLIVFLPLIGSIVWFCVGTYLQQSSDYRVYFVNPNATEILGQEAYPDLASLPEVPDIVDVFRKASDIPSVVDDVVAIGAPVIWVQLGIWNQDAAVDAEARGLTVVMDRCIKVEHARFHGGLHLLGFDTGVISSRKAAV
nr:CoA-binding protein [Clavibacter michiganensis]